MTDDGRNIDSEMGSLVGEAASQRAISDRTSGNLPALPEGASLSYYGLPLLQTPVWKWMIPAYYFIGGLSGATLVLGAAAQFSDEFEGREALTRRCHWIGFLGSGVSAVLLVADLGRHERFLNMLRVFRPTSPMNMGAWILSGVGAVTPLTLVLTGGLRRVFGLVAGLLGALLATYTGVLLGVTAVPIWQESRRTLPLLFGGSALASAGSVLQLLPGTPVSHAISGAVGRTGQVAELVAGAIMQRNASQTARVGQPFRNGASGVMWRTAAAFTAGSVVLAVLPGKSRAKQIAGGVLGVLGSALMRFSIEQLGKRSAQDARASFEQQRSGTF